MKTVLIFGSSGLIGNELLKLIRQNNNYIKIKLFVRSDPHISDPNIEIIQTDFNNLEKYKDLILGDECFFCIGTTHKETPDANEYRKVEYDMPVNIAKIAKTNSVKSFIYVSSMGANPKASGKYLKNKGQVEEELKKMNFLKLALIRPSILLGNRKKFRLGERIAIPIMKFLSLFFIGILKKYRPIKVENVAKAMIVIAENNYDKQLFESDKLENLANS